MARDIDLMPDERTVLQANPHWWYFWKQVAAGLGVVVAVALAWSTSGTLSGVLWVVAGVGLLGWVGDTLYAFAGWRSTRFVVTDARVAYQSGLIRRRGVSIPLLRVNNVNYEQSLIARMLGNGVVIIESAGDTGNSVFENIPDPDRVRRIIYEQMREASTAEAARGAAAMVDAVGGRPSRGASGPSPLEERLRRLDALQNQGLVSADEYERKRRELLEGL